MPNSYMHFLDTFQALPFKTWKALVESTNVAVLYWAALSRYNNDFFNAAFRAYISFIQEEFRKLGRSNPRVARDYPQLLRFNAALTAAALEASLDKARDYHFKEYVKFLSSIVNTFTGRGEAVDEYMADADEALRRTAIDFPKAVKEIKKEYGFHFDDGGYVKIAETDRMLLYQVLPTEPGVVVNPGIKPVLIAHPYVLGPNILAFLPGERRSYVHSFANQSVPTYVRIIKDIHSNPAVQMMRGEDDALDTRFFAQTLVERHRKPVTLNGACQGGFILLADLLSGELDGLADAIITTASPIDGTKSPGLTGYLDGIPASFRDLAYAKKTLPNGNQVIDGEVMSWVYKLKSLDKEFPLFTFYRDLEGFREDVRTGSEKINKRAAAINYWLMYDRTDLPVKITNLSKLSYTVPLSREGNLPFRLFGRKLNLKNISKKGIKFLICYGAKDMLVEPASALAALEFTDAEVAEFPKGHAAILTSWSHPESEYALHKRFRNGQRGPVKFHLDLDESLSPVVSEHKKAACW